MKTLLHVEKKESGKKVVSLALSPEQVGPTEALRGLKMSTHEGSIESG
jgi:hypothetical protein